MSMPLQPDHGYQKFQLDQAYVHGLVNRTIEVCESECPKDVAQFVESEVELLTREGTPPLSTTLVVCPHVKAWKEDFNEFDEFVRVILRQRRNDTHIMQHVTFVAFHPSFCRWYGIPEGFGVGSVVDSHYGTIGQKSIQTTPATIIETNNKAFGLRKVKVRFHDTTLEGLGNRQEQYVPTDWIDFTKNEESCQALPLLPDNSMHQSPYPTISLHKYARCVSSKKVECSEDDETWMGRGGTPLGKIK